jgi:UDP-2-acetamido-2,6-beta-L-arabino-hexul-4-ose reductase
LKILITGSKGFIGKNLATRLKEIRTLEILTYERKDNLKALDDLVIDSDIIFHLAGENRPKNTSDFTKSNVELTNYICSQIVKSNKKIPIIFSSSIQVNYDNFYGKSKLEAEEEIKILNKETDNPAIIYRLPGVFGKWSKPNYNSVVATFCYNTIMNLPIDINNPEKELALIYIDDLVSNFIEKINQKKIHGLSYEKVTPEYSITVKELSEQIKSFNNSRSNLIYEEVGVGFKRALYSTFVSYFPPDYFIYNLPSHNDNRGNFVEMLKTSKSGQFSYFTAKPGVIRGEHYHHTKTEKFLIIKGSGKFNFRNIINNQTHELYTSGIKPQIVQTVPGWTHNIENIGKDDLVVMLWANEIFDPNVPDTIPCKVFK